MLSSTVVGYDTVLLGKNGIMLCGTVDGLDAVLSGG